MPAVVGSVAVCSGASSSARSARFGLGPRVSFGVRANAATNAAFAPGAVGEPHEAFDAFARVEHDEVRGLRR